MQDEPESPGNDSGSDSGFMDDLGFAEGRARSAATDPRPWRLAALVGVICAVVLLLAIALLNLGGGADTPKDVGLPSVTSTPSAALPTPTVASIPTSPATRTQTSARPRRTTHAPSTSAALSTSATPTPHLSTSQVVSAPSPGVTVGAGPRDYRCGNDCRFVVVRLTNFAGGHLVQCVSAGGKLFGGDAFARVAHQYVTAQPVSFNCSFRGPGVVWAVVDGHYQSNHLGW